MRGAGMTAAAVGGGPGASAVDLARLSPAGTRSCGTVTKV